MAKAQQRKTDAAASLAAGQVLYVTKPLNIDDASGNRRSFKIGDPFDYSLVAPRRLRQLIDGHSLDFNPPMTEAAHGGAA